MRERLIVDPAEVAATVVAMANDGRFAEVERLFATRLRAVVSAETLRVDWAAEMSRIGGITAIGRPATEPGHAGLVRVSVPVTGPSGGLLVVMSVDDDGQLHGLRIAALAETGWAPPPYAVPSRFTEQEIRLGAGAFAVPGTLTLPTGRGRRPGVVLLSGGGAFDRDETSGANKPLKDIAWGLASRGVAVVRFDMVTMHHPGLAAEPGFTATDEYVPHAVAAVRLLKEQSTVDPERIFVVGHSMGGRVAPRVAAAEPSVAGLVLLAGDNQPMHHAAARVARYLAAVSPEDFEKDALASVDRWVALVDSPELSPETPAADLPFGWSGSYWLDLRADDPVARAVALAKPMLILQGGRDYQVTVADDLAAWRAGLADRRDVTIQLYDADDHLFFPGTGPSTPAGYVPAQHVDRDVIADIAEWVTPRTGLLRAMSFRRR
ncbi:MAG TPA: alpha/beta fold hydrolase [Pseudonocardiaceae bacterium]|jgi:hypothetical protein|nr:alpha/beta fold hydrolase [Pseudonocardiaceae bacterium]